MCECCNEYVQILKAMADETRLKIIEMLAAGELCACEILEYFKITQPTLSYHMKILTESGIVTGVRHGAWMHYSLNTGKYKKLLDLLTELPNKSKQKSGFKCCSKPNN